MTVSASITSKGQITIPKPIRDLLNLTQNDHLVFTVTKTKPNTVEVTPIKSDIMSLYGSIKTNQKYIDFKTARKKMEKIAAKEITSKRI